MTTLHDRLTALAEDVPVGPPETGLWARGRRLHRRRRWGSIAIAGVCCLLLLGGGFVDRQHSSVQPASGQAALALPDHIHQPSKWLLGTDGEPFDRLVAVIAAARGSWFGADPGWVGVSAETGEYRFLDLPQIAGQGDVVLSPDGRYVAYWITGTVPHPPPDADGAATVVGYAVYDVEHGETVVRETIESDEGLMVQDLFWLDRRTIAAPFSYLRWQGADVGSVGVDAEVRRHDIASGEAAPWPGAVDAGGSGWGVTWSHPSKARPVTDPGRVVRLVGESGVAPVPGPSGRHFAGLQPRNSASGRLTPNPIVVATLGPGDRQVRFEHVPNRTRYYGILGWRDEHTVVARRWTTESDADSFHAMGVYAVDIRTGEEVPVGIVAGETQVAADLLDLPVAERPAPPTPFGPWAKLGIAATLAALGAWGVWVWRRRVGP